MTRLLAILFALLMIAAACGDDDTSTTASPGDDPVANPAAPADPTAPADPEPDPDPAPEPPLGAGPYPIADLVITYEHPDVGTIEYQVVCLGDTATLLGDIDGVRDQQACSALADRAVQDRLIDGVPPGQVCTEQYGGPETARIVGRIDDQPVDTTVDRANGCGISDWDSLLSALLPDPRPFA